MPTDDVESLFQQLDNFRTSGQWARVKEIAGRLLTHEPDSSYLHHQLGYACLQLDDLEMAEKHLKRAIALDPEMDVAFQTLGYTYWQMGRHGTAEDHARMAVSLDPDDEENWILMGYLCLQFEDSKQALYCAERAAAIDPEDSRIIDIRTQAGAIAGGKEKLSPEAQISSYTKMLKENPEDDYTHTRIGAVYFDELKDFKKAEEHFRAALSLDPSDDTNQKLLVSTLRKRDPVLRILWAPFDFGMKILAIFEWSWRKKWPLIFLFFVAKFLLIGAVALGLIFFVLFWPMAKVYEWLTIAEIHKKMGKIAIYKGPLAKLHRLPFGVRCSIFAAIFATFWTAVIWTYLHEGNRNPILEWTSLLVGGGTLILVLFGWTVMLRDWARKKRRDKKNKIIHETSATG